MDKQKNDFLIDIAKTVLVQDGQIPFTLLCLTGTKKNPKSYTVFLYFENEQEKLEAFKYIYLVNTILGVNSYYIITESWMLPEKEKEEGREIRLHFQKKRCVLIGYYKDGKGTGSNTIFKKVNNRFIFEETIFNGIGLGGRVSQLTSWRNKNFMSDNLEEIRSTFPFFRDFNKKQVIEGMIDFIKKYKVHYVENSYRTTKNIFF